MRHRVHRPPAPFVLALALAATGCDGGGTEPTGPTGTPNLRPVAAFTATPTEGAAPLEVRFDASASADPDGTIAQYAWSFGDGTTGSGAVVTHTYTQVGAYTPTLTVTDGRGATGSATGNRINVSSPAGTGQNQITGVVWHDADADGKRGPGERGVPDMVIFLDADGDGVRDDGETSALTDTAGIYRFEGLDGTRSYTVTQELTIGWTNTAAGDLAGGSAAGGASPDGPARIIGGTQATPGEFPFQVALVTAATQFQFCGGTLIAARWVMTASHCVDGGTQPAAIRVLAGTHDLRTGGQLLTVTRILLHPNYSATAFVENDIALLELAAPVALSRVELMTPERGALAAPGVTATVVGWGRTGISGGTGSPTLKKLQAGIISNDTCAQQLGENILPATICAGQAGSNESVCNGDSGGPLLVPFRGRWLQAGIVSFGANFCYQPTAFARVSALVGFVRQHVAPEASRSVTVDWSGGGTTARVDFADFR